MTAPQLSVIIPAFNEEPLIEQVALEAMNTLEQHAVGPFELILVDDGSSDRTGAIMQELARRYPCVRSFANGRNRGMGGALKTGLANVSAPAITWIPGDGQFDVAEVLPHIPKLDRYDIIYAIREGRNEASRNLISYCFHGSVRLLFNFDATGYCGIFAIRRELAREIQPRAEDVFFMLEFLLGAVKLGKRMDRMTVRVRPRLAGKSKVANVRRILLNLWEMARCRFGS